MFNLSDLKRLPTRSIYKLEGDRYLLQSLMIFLQFKLPQTEARLYKVVQSLFHT